MRVALDLARVRHLDEARLDPQVRDRLGAAVGHAGPRAADELVQDSGQRPGDGDARLHSLRHELVAVDLRVAVAAGRHGAQRAHPAVLLDDAPADALRLAGALLGHRQQPAEHDRIRSGGQGLDDVAGVADAAVADDRDVGFARRRGAHHDRGELRDADAGHDPSGADAPGPDAHLHPVRARLDERGRPLGRGHVPGHEVDRVSERGAIAAQGVDDVAGVAVGRVHAQGVDTGTDQRLGPRHGIRTDADGGRHAQPPVGIDVGERGVRGHRGRLDGRDLLRLALRRLVAVDHADAALDRHGDRPSGPR